MPHPALVRKSDERCNPLVQDRFESHLVAIREQLDGCLKAILTTESSLETLCQHLSIGAASVYPSDVAKPTHSAAADQPLRCASEKTDPPQPESTMVALSDPEEAVSAGAGDASLHQGESFGIQYSSRSPRMLRSATTLSFSSLHISTTFRKRRQRSKFAIKLWKLLGEPGSSREASWANRASAFLISVSVILILYDSGAQWASSELAILQLAFDGVFSFELLARFYCCPSRRVFLTEVYTFFEAIASIPILIVRAQYNLDGPLEPDTWPYIVLVALLPVLRLLMVIRRFEQIHLQVSAFRSAAQALPVMLFPLSILITGFASLLFIAEPRSNLASFSDALWLTIVTCFTVGYGNMVPETQAGICVVSGLMVISALFMAIPIGIVGDAFSRVWEGREALLLVRRMTRRLQMAKIGANDIAALFDRFDQNKKGWINKAEFIAIIRSMSVNLDDAQVIHLFNILDADGNGQITDREFLRVLFPSDFEEIYSAFNSVVDVTKQVATSAINTPQHIVQRVSLPAQQLATLASETASLVSGVSPIRLMPTERSRRWNCSREDISGECVQEGVI